MKRTGAHQTNELQDIVQQFAAVDLNRIAEVSRIDRMGSRVVNDE